MRLAELAIFINLGLPHYLGQSLPFIAPICISTIQLGATVDYAILMTTRYKAERSRGKGKREAVSIALGTSIPLGDYRIRHGPACRDVRRGSVLQHRYNQLHVARRRAVRSRGMLRVIFIPPAMLMLFDCVIRHTLT